MKLYCAEKKQFLLKLIFFSLFFLSLKKILIIILKKIDEKILRINFNNK